MKNLRKQWKIISAALVVLIVIAAAALLFAFHKLPWLDSGNSATQTPFGSLVAAGDTQYSNARYHFSLSYPSDLQVQTYGGTGEDLTVVFQDPTTNEGFQVFVVPYDQNQVSAARFKLDEPSGVMLNSTSIVVDGTTANMFYSTNTTMGDTREVWFIRDGLLYEVTTYKQLDTWLAQIMSTWKFE